LALVFYEKLLPGTQLVNRLQDLGYRVHTVPELESLPACAEQEKPMLALVDLKTTKTNANGVIARLKSNAATSHVPVIGFADEKDTALHESALAAGATVVAGDVAIVTHLEHFLERALRLD
jgi:PleD family two-component response regulator